MAPPADHRAPALVHVDLDGAAEIHAAHGWAYRHDDDPLFLSGLRNTLDLLDALGIRATLFAITHALEDPEKRALVAEAVRRGHRLGSHTVTHRWLPSLPREEQRREVADSRAWLEDTFGVKVAGFRAPGFGIDDAVVDLVAEAGYAWDSSFFPGTRPTTAPYTLRPGLSELPLPRYRPLPLPFHPSYSLVLGNWYFGTGLAVQRRSGGPLVVLLHLTDLADPLPAHYLSGWKARIFTLSYLSAATKRRRCRAMLEAARATHRWLDSEDPLLADRPADAGKGQRV